LVILVRFGTPLRLRIDGTHAAAETAVAGGVGQNRVVAGLTRANYFDIVVTEGPYCSQIEEPHPSITLVPWGRPQ